MRRFLAADLAELNGWYAARGLPLLTGDMLPSLGYLVPGIAAGWLYRTDAPAVVLLEGLVSNPAAPLRARDRALRSLVEALTAEAIADGARHVLGLTRSRGMERLVGRLGFVGIGTYRMVEWRG